MLTDPFGRLHNYLRLSLTDRCNFRCSYCMPGEGYSCLPQEEVMNAGEIEAIASVFVKTGIQKIRLTGGEPLLRKDFAEIVSRLSGLKTELLLTTNGALLHQHIGTLKQGNIQNINVSLDSLQPGSFKQITGRDIFPQVWQNIQLLLAHDFRVKINVVAIRGFIEKELHQFVELTRHLPLHVRFIEFMPFAGNEWNSRKVITAAEMLSLVSQEYDVVKLQDEPNATARKYKAIGFEGSIAFITTMSQQFCSGCNRLRLTAGGRIKNCLFGKEELDLLSALRSGLPLEPLIQQSVERKFAAMGGQFENGYQHTDASRLINRSMVGIGG